MLDPEGRRQTPTVGRGARLSAACGFPGGPSKEPPTALSKRSCEHLAAAAAASGSFLSLCHVFHPVSQSFLRSIAKMVLLHPLPPAPHLRLTPGLAVAVFTAQNARRRLISFPDPGTLREDVNSFTNCPSKLAMDGGPRSGEKAGCEGRCECI